MITEYIYRPLHVFLPGFTQTTQVTILTELQVFSPGDVMKRQQVDLSPRSRQTGNKLRKRPEAPVIIVDTADQGDTHLDGRAALGKSLEIDEDQPVVDAGKASVLCGIDHFQIVEKEVRMLSNLEQSFGFDMPGGIDSTMDIPRSTGIKELQEKIGIHERLASGEGHPAAGLVEEGSFLFDHLNQLCNGQ